MNPAAPSIAGWIIGRGLDGTSQAELMGGYCERLVEAGVPLWRASIGIDTLHPLIDARGVWWVSGEGVTEDVFLRGASPEQEADWRRSPWFRLIEDGEPRMRRRLARGEGTNEFPLLASLAARGATDYLARIVAFGERGAIGEAPCLSTSWTTSNPNGFAEEDISLVEETLPAFALALKTTIGADTTRTLVTTYLGRDPAERILRGEIERGKVNTERKVIWFSDLTGFTRIADTMPREQLLDLLNAYSDCLVGVVLQHGGEVLKFMGDGILAVFEGAEGGCQSALEAAEASRSAVVELNRSRTALERPTTGFTLALHEGEVLYGNVGSRERLDFTVLGPAVNETSRIQAMSRSLDQPILVSASFARSSGEHRKRLVSVGRYVLRGVDKPQELFTLDPSFGVGV
jgi:adenylate cyclase